MEKDNSQSFVSILNSGLTLPFPISAENSEIQLGGAEVRIQPDFDASPTIQVEPLGYLLAIPQVPPWMSPHFSEVWEASQTGGPKLSEYTVEWFERIVFIDLASASTIVQDQNKDERALALGFLIGDALLQSEYSRGCAKTAPLVEAYQFNFQSGLTKIPGRFHALIDGFEGTSTSMVKSMRLVPVGENLHDSLNKLVQSNRHQQLKLLHTSDAGTLSSLLQFRTLSAIRRDPSIGEPT